MKLRARASAVKIRPSAPNAARCRGLPAVQHWPVLLGAFLALIGNAPVHSAPVEQAWSVRQNPPGSTSRAFAALTTDDAGNAYVLSYASFPTSTWSQILTKYDPAGAQLWQTRLDASSQNDFASAPTLKHSPTGTLLWAARYHAEEPASMSAVDVRVDGSNNVVTAGNLYGHGTNDAVLVKYRADGQQLWANRVPHPVHAFHLSAFDMDGQGNTYLTGTPHSDTFTIKIGASGNQLWSIEYNSEDPLYDYGAAIKLDAAGNVFIAGRSHYFDTKFISLVKYRQTATPGGPVVSVSPTNQVVPPGPTIAFSATATGTGPLDYQWRFTGRPIPGATSSVLIVTNVQPANRGDYSVMVSNAVGTAVSPEARLTVLLKPVVSVLPSNQVAFLGASAAFIASFADTPPFDYYWRGTEPFTYQWRHEGITMSGATNATFRITNLATSDAGSYSFVVNNPAGSVTSSVVALTVSSAVEQLPARRYRGSEISSQDKPLIKVTASGETVVAAASQGIGTGTDIVVLKYGTNDQLLWSARYNREYNEPDAPSDLALSELCAAYYEPVVAFLRRSGSDGELAREMAHEFFAHVLEKPDLGGAEPGRGRFRSYLLGALKHHLSHLRERAARQKRGGGVDAIPLSAGTDTSPGVDPLDARTLPPDREFDRQWAMHVLKQAMMSLESEWRAAGKDEEFALLQPMIAGEPQHGGLAALAEARGLNASSLRKTLSRLRQRFRHHVKAAITPTLAEGVESDDEMRQLLAALSA